MNPILQAMRYGHSSNSILDYLKNLDPELATKITLALQAGQTADSIVSYLLKAGKKVSSVLPDASKEKEVDYTNLYEVSKKGHPSIPGMVKTGLAVGAGLALGPMLSRFMAAPAAIEGELLPAQAALEYQPQKLLPGLQTGGQIPPPRPQSFSPYAPDVTGAMQQQAIQRATGAGIPQPTSSIVQQAGMAQAQGGQPVVAQPAVSKAMQLVASANLIPHIANFAKNNKDPNAVTALLYSKFPKEMKKLQKDAGVPMEQAIAEVMQQMPELAQPEQRLLERPESSSLESGLPSMTSPMEIPGGALDQQLPVQASTKPESSAARTMTESTLEGPITLGSIDPTSNRIIRHAYKNVDEIYQNIEAKHPEFKSFLENVKSNIPGISLVQSRLKEKEALQKKISQKGSPETISDYMGGRVVFDNDKALSKTLDQLNNKYKIIEEENFLENPRWDGYRAIHLQVDLGNGTSAELQLQPKEIKEDFDKAHKIYDKWKRVESYDKKQFMQAFQDTNEMKQIFDDAWERYQNRSNKAEIGSQVITPKGDIGTIEKISGQTAQIKTDEGKAGSRLDEVIEVPEEYNTTLEIYKKLIESIPEDQKSAVLNYMGYDPDRKKLSLRFHSGDQYTYEDIPEEIAHKIANAMHIARTDGGNLYGVWSKGESSRGSGVYDLIKELQAAYGKGHEYTAKYKTLYDYFALPKQLLADEDKRKKDEARQKKAAAKKSVK